MVEKGRTPLLLVFGAHPGRCGPLTLEGDREFFRSNLEPFVDRWVVGSLRKAVMIHEYPSMDSRVGHRAHIDHERKEAGRIRRDSDMLAAQRRLDSLTLSITASLGRTLGSGRDLEAGMEWFDWGCADVIRKINSSRPGTIMNLIEPLVVEAAVLINHPGRSVDADDQQGRLQAEKESVARAVEICRIRSSSLAQYIKSLRDSEPGRPIMVTRGFAHKGMESFFDPAEFDITSASRLLGAPWPSTEAAIMGMTGTISDQDLTRFARLSMHFGQYYEERMLEHMLDSIEGGVFNERKFAMLSRMAGEYAHSMVRN